MLKVTRAIQETLYNLGVIARVVRYRRGQPRDRYHFHTADFSDPFLWQVVLRYRGRFAGVCLYASGQLNVWPSPYRVLASAVEEAMDQVHGPYGTEANKRRGERVLGRLKEFLGSAAYWDIVNAVEENGR